MALIKCRYCGLEISDKAPDCIHCGALIIKDDTNTSTSSAQLLSEKEKLETEKDVLSQRNYELESQILDSQRTITAIERERQVLEIENSKYKTAVAEAEHMLSNEQNEKASLTTEREALLQRNSELERQISDSQKSVKYLEKKIEQSKKLKNIKKGGKVCFKTIVGILRLILMSFFILGALVCLLSNEYGLALWYGSIAVAVAPFVYRILWKRVKLDKSVRVAIEIVVPIIVSMIITIF